MRCQHIEIEQVAETARLIGSRPYWLWGFEHGLNEHGVAIGNHTVFTKDPLGDSGLLGMDLVRLGLERGHTATEAVDVITSLLERYGQGGSGYADKSWPYHNSFLVADRSGAILLETSDRHWAARRVLDVGSASNHLSIGDDWDALAPGTIEHAVAQGWWSEEGDRRFDFAAAFRDTTFAPEVISSGRHQRTCSLLEGAKGGLTAADLRSALRDHYDGGPLYEPKYSIEDPRYFSVCMHADPVGTTTASMIAVLPRGEDAAPVYWASMGSPCLGVFLPFSVETGVPEILGVAGAEPSTDSPWWRFKELLTLVERDWSSLAPKVRAFWDPYEARVIAEAAEVEAATAGMRRNGRARVAEGLRALSRRRAQTRRTVSATLEKLEKLISLLREAYNS